MPNIALVLKQEVSRIARKEVRQECASLQTQIRNLRDTVNKQKKTIEKLEKTISRLDGQIPKSSKPIQAPIEAEEGKVRVRMSAASIKRIRDKFAVSQAQMGQLLGVSTNTIVRWEAGSSTPRDRYKLLLAELRGIGKREIKKRLAKNQETEDQETEDQEAEQ